VRCESLGWVSQLVAVALLLLGCGEDASRVCVAGEVELCTCLDGSLGSQACDSSGGFGACQCGSAGASCFPGEVMNCACPDGTPSTQSCGPGNQYTVCMCQAQGGTGAVGGGTGAVGGDGSGGMMLTAGDPGVAIPNPQDEAAFVWDDSQLQTYELQIAQQDLDFLDSAPADEIYVPGTLIYGQESYPVGVRYKGSVGGYVGCVSGGGGLNPASTSGRKTCPKLSMKVSFNWTNNGTLPDGGRFHGLKKLQFHSMNSDASMMRDRLGYALFREMGIASPRAVHARLIINGQYEGLFINVEQIDSRFTRAHFTDGGDGNLYKEVWPKWTNPGDYMLGLRTNETDPGLSFDKVVRFAQGIGATTGQQQALDVARQWMDMNYVYKFIAVDRAIVHDDGMFHWYCQGGLISLSTGNNPGPCSNHNYYVYESQTADYLWLVPWDLDLSFGGESQITPITEAWNDTNVSCSTSGGGASITPQMAPGCDKLTAGWAFDNAAYQAAIRELLAGPFAQGNVDGKLDAWSAQISNAVGEQAQNLGGGQDIPSVNNWQSAVSSLRQYVNSRRNAMQSLAN